MTLPGPVLVTGAAGLIGYEVCRQLAAAGVAVVGIDREPPSAGCGFPFIAADILSDGEVARIVSDGGVRQIVHAAAISGPMLFADDPCHVAKVNVGGATTVFEAARHSGCRLVWLSSIAYYGNRSTLDPVREDAPPNPRSFYGRTKVAGEVLLRGYRDLYGLDAVALRLSSVYGLRRRTRCALDGLIRAGLAGASVRVAPAGTNRRQFIHVEDAARAILSALERPEWPSFAYNITGHDWTPEKEIVELVARSLPGLMIEVGEERWDEGYVGPLDGTAAVAELGYCPKIALVEGVRRLIPAIMHAEATRT